MSIQPPIPPGLRTTTTGPKIMVGFAALSAILTIGAIILTAFSFMSVIPRVLTTNGQPGEDVIATTEVPGTITADLATDKSYSLWIVDTGMRSRIDEPITVTDASGNKVDLRISGSSTVTIGGKQARLLYSFDPRVAGEHVIELPEATTAGNVEVFLSYAQSPGKLVGGIFGIVGGVFAIILFGAATLALGIGGGFWWRSRVRKRKRFAATPPPYQHPGAW